MIQWKLALSTMDQQGFHQNSIEVRVRERLRLGPQNRQSFQYLPSRTGSEGSSIASPRAYTVWNSGSLVDPAKPPAAQEPNYFC